MAAVSSLKDGKDIILASLNGALCDNNSITPRKYQKKYCLCGASITELYQSWGCNPCSPEAPLLARSHTKEVPTIHFDKAEYDSSFQDGGAPGDFH